MVLIIIILVSFITWLLFAPLILNIDTRRPGARIEWKGLGNAVITYRQEAWWLKFRVLFFRKELNLSTMKRKPKKKKTKEKRHKRKKFYSRNMRAKGLRILRSCRVLTWKISLDSGNNVYNAWLYPANYLFGFKHCNINFYGENYLVLKLKNNVGRMLYAWFY